MNKLIYKDLMESISPLNPQQQIRLAVSLAQRMWIIYAAFCEKYQFGDPAFLKNALEMALKGETTPLKDDFWDRKEDICPDTEDFPIDYWTTASLDTCALVYEILLFAEDKDPAHWEAIWASIFNIPFMYLDDFSENPYQESLMQDEINLIKTHIRTIQENKTLEYTKNHWLERIREVV